MNNMLIETGHWDIESDIDYDLILKINNYIDLDLDKDEFLNHIIKYVNKFYYDVIYLFMINDMLYIDHISRNKLTKINRNGVIIYPKSEFIKNNDLLSIRLLNNIKNFKGFKRNVNRNK